jgi:hypothetical protein
MREPIPGSADRGAMLVNKFVSFDTLRPGEAAAGISGHLARSLQSALAVDAAIIYLGPYAQCRRLSGLPQLCQSAGAFADRDATSVPEDELRCLTDPLTAYRNRIGYFACSPIIGADELPLGRVAVISSRAREMPAEFVDLIRATARTIEDILRVASQ